MLLLPYNEALKQRDQVALERISVPTFKHRDRSLEQDAWRMLLEHDEFHDAQGRTSAQSLRPVLVVEAGGGRIDARNQLLGRALIRRGGAIARYQFETPDVHWE